MIDRNSLLGALKQLLPAQFGEVQTRFGLPPAYVRINAAQAEQLERLSPQAAREANFSYQAELGGQALPRDSRENPALAAFGTSTRI